MEEDANIKIGRGDFIDIGTHSDDLGVLVRAPEFIYNSLLG